MGLDTSHGCWHGPYSSFMRWRAGLHNLLTNRRDGSSAEALLAAYERGAYADQSIPINVLMNHSDCDGEIAPELCGPIADKLQELVDESMPERAMYDDLRPATVRFIQGLRAAAKAGEPVRFG